MKKWNQKQMGAVWMMLIFAAFGIFGMTVHADDAIDFSTCTVSLEQSAYVYTGDSIYPVIHVTDANGNEISSYSYKISSDGVNYNSSVKSVKDAGTYQLIAYSNSYYNYSQTSPVTFTVSPKDINDAAITVSELATRTYQGVAITPTITLKDGTKTIDSSCYQLTYANNVDAGIATVTIEAAKDESGNYSGNYQGARQVTFTIVKSLSKVTFSEVANVTYKGAAVTPQVTLTDTLADGSTRTLTQDVDYTVSYESNNSCGVGRIVITGMGCYKDYHLIKFGILPGKVKGVKVSSPHAMEATVTWKKVNGADGFYVYRKASGGNYTFIATITDGNYQVFHDINKSLVNGKRYSYRIVPFVTDDNYNEKTDGSSYTAPKTRKSTSEDSLYSGNYTSYTSYYNDLYLYYDYSCYSCIKGKCNNAYVSDQYGEASGKVTKSTNGKRYAIYTQDADIDYMAYLINKKIVKSSMGTDARVSAIYNWMVKNCTFTKDVKDSSQLSKFKCYFNYNKKSNHKKALAYEEKLKKQIYKGTALSNGTTWCDEDRARTALAYRKGSCSFLTPMFNILCGAAGVESYRVDGDYVNSDKSRMYHNWSLVNISGTYYWYDVPVACKNKNIKQLWYKKGTKYWKTCHSWESSLTKGIDTSRIKK